MQGSELIYVDEAPPVGGTSGHFGFLLGTGWLSKARTSCPNSDQIHSNEWAATSTCRLGVPFLASCPTRVSAPSHRKPDTVPRFAPPRQVQRQIAKMGPPQQPGKSTSLVTSFSEKLKVASAKAARGEHKVRARRRWQ